MTTLTKAKVRAVIANLLKDSGNHRTLVFDDINRRFLERVLLFFQEVARAKLRGEEVSVDDWYIAEVMQPSLDSTELGLRAGIPKKTVFNLYGSGRREIVIEASKTNIDALRSTIDELVAIGYPEVMLTIKLNHVGVDLTVSESLIVINAIAVMRQNTSGSVWAGVGNGVEVPLMETLCQLFQVDPRHYRSGVDQDGRYQVDFMLTKAGSEYRCEVKLNGRGNPESVTAAFGRDPRVLIADYISDQNREKLAASQIEWVDLSEPNGFLRFGQVLAVVQYRS